MSIIDVHSHFWQFPEHFNDDFRSAGQARAGVELDLTVTFEDYQRTSVPDVRTIVFGGKAKLSGLWVDDRSVREITSRILISCWDFCRSIQLRTAGNASFVRDIWNSACAELS